MYQNLTNEMKDGFKPLMNMFDIQSQTAQKLLREQMDFMSECLNLTTEHADQLRNSDDNSKYFRIPVDASREIGERANGVMTRQWNILMEARDALTGEVQSVAKNAESSVKRASEEAEKTVKQATAQADKAAADATSKSSSSSSKSSTSSASKN